MVAVGPAHENEPEEQQHHANQQQRHNEVRCRDFFLGNKAVGFQNAGLGLRLEGIPHLLAESVGIRQSAGHDGIAVVGRMELQCDLPVLYDEAADLLIAEQLHDLGVRQAADACIKNPQDPGKGNGQDQQVHDQTEFN